MELSYSHLDRNADSKKNYSVTLSIIKMLSDLGAAHPDPALYPKATESYLNYLERTKPASPRPALRADGYKKLDDEPALTAKNKLYCVLS